MTPTLRRYLAAARATLLGRGSRRRARLERPRENPSPPNRFANSDPGMAFDPRDLGRGSILVLVVRGLDERG